MKNILHNMHSEVIKVSKLTRIYNTQAKLHMVSSDA